MGQVCLKHESILCLLVSLYTPRVKFKIMAMTFFDRSMYN